LNLFLRELAEIAQQQLLTTKWLLAPSLRVGNQWLESVVRTGQPVVGFRVLTPAHLAMDLAAGPLAKQQLRLLPHFVAGFLMDDLLAHRETTYLKRTEHSPNLANAILGTIAEIRLSGLQLKDLETAGFEAKGKGTDLCNLLADYQNYLAEINVLDRAGMLQLAIEHLSADPAVLPDNVLLLVPDCIHPKGLEAQLIATIPEGIRCQLPASSSAVPETDIQRLAELTQPAAAPPPLKDDSVRMFRAVGAVNEVRQVLRTVLAEKIPLDDIEIIHTNHDTYVPLIHEIVLGLYTDDQLSAPITFAEGISASSGRPGRALTAWLSWIEEDFDQQLLVRMLHEGLLNIEMPSDIPRSVITSELRRLGIGKSRDRYLEKIQEQIASTELQIKKQSDIVYRDEERISDLEHRRIALAVLKSLLEKLLAISDARATPDNLLCHSRSFLLQHAVSDTEVDNYAREALVDEIQKMQSWTTNLQDISQTRLLVWLRGLPARKRILGNGPRAGKIHVSHVLSGGHSGRKNTFILGLDDGNFPGHVTQDPILLDREREQFHGKLIQSGDKLEQQIYIFVQTISRLPGRVTLSYPCMDLVDDRELFPSSLMLSAFRILSGDRDADQHTMEKYLGSPFSFANTGEAENNFLNETEWWLSKLCGPEPIQNPLSAVHERYAHLKQGMKATDARESDVYTIYDGHVVDAGNDFDPAKLSHAFSASGLETLGLCPLKYFFSHVLYIRALDELVLDPDRWLDPLIIGSLLHSVFENFLSQLHGQNQIPDFDRDEDLLMQLLHDQITATRKEIPPPNEASYRRQRAQLLTTARMFLRRESEYCQSHRPEYFEASIGLPPEGEGTPIDQRECVEITLPGKTKLKSRGRVDRIDRVGSNAFSICDYKTGGSYKYSQDDPFRQGRVVQNALYLAIVEPVLQKYLGPNNTVSDFNFFFPSRKTWGQRIKWKRDTLLEGLPIIEKLCKSVAAGAFIPTDKKEDCNFCDYNPVCGNVDALCSASKTKIDNEENVPLIPIRGLRRNG